jgi:hypothetical protein
MNIPRIGPNDDDWVVFVERAMLEHADDILSTLSALAINNNRPANSVFPTVFETPRSETKDVTLDDRCKLSAVYSSSMTTVPARCLFATRVN